MRYRPEHRNRSTQTLVVYTGKHSRTRTISLSARRRGAGRSGSRGRHRTVLDVHRPPGVQPCRSAAGDSRSPTYGSPPQLRHGLSRVAADTRLFKDVLGHSDTRMTERYTLGHVLDAMRLAASRLEEHLGAPEAPPAARERAACGAEKLAAKVSGRPKPF